MEEMAKIYKSKFGEKEDTALTNKLKSFPVHIKQVRWDYEQSPCMGTSMDYSQGLYSGYFYQPGMCKACAWLVLRLLYVFCIYLFVCPSTLWNAIIICYYITMPLHMAELLEVCSESSSFPTLVLC